MKNTVIFMAVACLLLACGGSKKDAGQLPSGSAIQLTGDRTIYGLACEGCTDSVLVLLPSDCSDPLRYEIIEARQHGRIFGKLKIGDRLAVLVDQEDTLTADMVINLELLKGTWCYTVMPQMRDYEKMSKRMQRRIMRDMPDSMKRTFLIPREYGFTLKSNNVANPVGFVKQVNALEEESPVVYPPVPSYAEWHIWNGKLILVQDSLKLRGMESRAAGLKLDTAELVFMRDDSLVLRFRQGVQGYYRHTNAADVNKQARAIAEEQTQKAIDEAK